MQVVWTTEALDDLEAILAWYLTKAGPATAAKVQARIVGAVDKLRDFPERIRESERIPGTRELVIHPLPYVAFVQPQSDHLVVLNVVHGARRFPE